jgi:hypothetical protein
MPHFLWRKTSWLHNFQLYFTSSKRSSLNHLPNIFKHFCHDGLLIQLLWPSAMVHIVVIFLLVERTVFVTNRILVYQRLFISMWSCYMFHPTVSLIWTHISDVSFFACTILHLAKFKLQNAVTWIYIQCLLFEVVTISIHIFIPSFYKFKTSFIVVFLSNSS